VKQIELPLDAGDSPPTIDRRVAEAQAAWKADARALSRLATAVGPLAKPRAYEDLGKLPALIDKVAAKCRALPAGERASALLDEVRAELRQRRERIRQDLARELRAACEARGLTLAVVRNEDPVEIRIAPFAVTLDQAKGNAELRFARLPIARCEARAETIMKMHTSALASMRSGFDAGRFFEDCLCAWKAARAARGGAPERVEIADFLPYLALQVQPRKFRIDPTARNYRGYSRARFAFDVMQLRERAGLRRDGWRMNLGVATGTTASKKNRSLFMEDPHGHGEYKLTVFFTREEARP